jgi:hypothetical protein
VTDEDFVELHGIRNESVTFVECREVNEAKIDGRMFILFPNLECFSVAAATSVLIEVPCEKLGLMATYHCPNHLVYRPPLVDFDQELDFNQELLEWRITKLLHCSAINVEILEIGRDEWLEQGIKLSTVFWKNTIEVLKKLETIVVFNSGSIKDLAQLFIRCKRHFESVEIWTDGNGKNSLQGMELPPWMKIFVAL